MENDNKEITVGELRRQLAEYPDETEISFSVAETGKPLAFYRVFAYENPGLVGIHLGSPDVGDQ
jgi:hypothetical protein